MTSSERRCAVLLVNVVQSRLIVLRAGAGYVHVGACVCEICSCVSCVLCVCMGVRVWVWITSYIYLKAGLGAKLILTFDVMQQLHRRQQLGPMLLIEYAQIVEIGRLELLEQFEVFVAANGTIGETIQQKNLL